MKVNISSAFAIGFATIAMLIVSAGGLLTNGSFETGDLTGWVNPGSGGSANVGAPTNVPAQDGNFAALITQAGGVGELGQTFPANPGDEFNLSGYMLTEAVLPAGPSFGVLKIVFRDANGVDLIPASASIGQINNDFPGIESLPFLDSLQPADTWVFSEAQGVAPAGTTQVLFLALNVDFAGGVNPIWFDNIRASLEPGGSNLLTNGSFETGDLTGWSNPGGSGGSATVGAPVNVPAQDGDFAALITLGGGVGELRQTFPASPGDEYNMSGYMLTETAIPAGPSFGLLKIVFRDANGVDLLPASASIGQINTDFPGIESLPFLDSTQPVDTWVFSEAQGVAPAGTTQVLFLALNVDFAGGENPIWFDNIQASLVGPNCPTDFTLGPDCFQQSGSFSDSCDSDDVYWGIQSTTFAARFAPAPINIELDGVVPIDGNGTLTFCFEGHPTLGGGTAFLTVALFNYTTGLYEQTPFTNQPDGSPGNDTTYCKTVDNSNGDYVDGEGNVKARITCAKTGAGPVRLFIDSMYWE